MDNLNKTYADCYLYKQHPAYSGILLDAIVKSDRIDKEAKGFEEVVYEVKRNRVNNALLKVLTSKNTQLLLPPSPLPKPFKVFCAKDVKYDRNTIKVFIDCSSVITPDTNGYRINDAVLIAHLINAETSMIYALKPNMIINNGRIRELGSNCFSSLFTHIVDYVGKISVVEYARDKCLYLSSRYFLTNVMMLDNENTIRDISRKIAGITEMKENTYDYLLTKPKGNTEDTNPFKSLKTFTALINDTFKLDGFTTDLLVEKWMYLYGQDTPFALEFFPTFSAMMTNAYSGTFINNQKTIENKCGRNMIEYAKTIINELEV